MAALRILCAGRPERAATVWLMAGELSAGAREQKARLEREAPWVRVEVIGEEDGDEGEGDEMVSHERCSLMAVLIC